ncbi:MAG: hypothetical protein EAZ67_04405 [Cytophagales bacterium]|nr:MAG: hypothetical protein EAZ67_04405 [Cytophagales bacterium]
MSNVTESQVAKRLESLLRLQMLDSKLDDIKKIKGDLPEEVQDLEDEIAGYETRIKKIKEDIKDFDQQILGKENDIKEHQKHIQKYEDQKMNVRNDREFSAINREVESQELDIQLAHKAIKNIRDKIAQKEEQVKDTQKQLEERKKDLVAKKKELSSIIAEKEEDENRLLKDREKRIKGMEDRLYKPYMRLRENLRNGLAVVLVKRDACGGCFNMVPPQKRVDIKEKKKIVVCEHCGRIFADVEEHIVQDKKKISRKKVAGSTSTGSVLKREFKEEREIPVRIPVENDGESESETEVEDVE